MAVLNYKGEIIEAEDAVWLDNKSSSRQKVAITKICEDEKVEPPNLKELNHKHVIKFLWALLISKFQLLSPVYFHIFTIKTFSNAQGNFHTFQYNFFQILLSFFNSVI